MGFPLHVPRVPLRWDEPIWMHELAMNTDERIVQVIRTKRNNEVRYFKLFQPVLFLPFITGK